MGAWSRGPWLALIGAIAIGLGFAAWAAAGLFRLGIDWRWFDQAVHALSTFGVTLVIAGHARGAARRGPALTAPDALVLACAGIGVGALWEVAEGLYDRFGGGTLIKGKYDTMNDLLADAVGAFAAALVLWLLTAYARTSLAGAPDSRR